MHSGWSNCTTIFWLWALYVAEKKVNSSLCPCTFVSLFFLIRRKVKTPQNLFFFHLMKIENFDDVVLFPLDYVADSPRDSVQFIEWSPAACPRALLIANFHGRITIWTNPTEVSRHLSSLFSQYLITYQS